jgi:hypothetical protein
MAKKYVIQVWNKATFSDIDGIKHTAEQWNELPFPYTSKSEAMRFIRELEADGKRCKLIERSK